MEKMHYSQINCFKIIGMGINDWTMPSREET